MYCPKCNQQQVSGNVRFCSRCGFPLETVANLLAHDGVPIALETKDEQPLSTLQKGVRQGTALMLTSLVAGFIAALLSIFVLGKPELFVPLVGGAIFLCGLLRILYAYAFESDTEIQRQSFEPAQLSATSREYLPPAQAVSVAGFDVRRVNTAEIAMPPSVTEHTTKLLKDE